MKSKENERLHNEPIDYMNFLDEATLPVSSGCSLEIRPALYSTALDFETVVGAIRHDVQHKGYIILIYIVPRDMKLT